MMQPLLIGVLLAAAIAVLASGAGLDRDRALYPVVTIVVASYYALFAVMGATPQVLLLEILAGTVFLVAAVAGFRSSLWITAVALGGHGLFDFIHGALIANPGVPAWWPPFCGGIDVALGLFMGWCLRSGRIRARA